MKKTLLILFFLAGIANCYSQNTTKNYLFTGIGVGSSNNSQVDGLGVNWSIGYQRELWNNRLRIVPSLSYGTYNNKQTTDVADAHYNSTNLKVNLNFDLLKINSFSLFLGTGVTGNYTSGLIGQGIFLNDSKSPGFFNETNITYNELIGLRVIPKNNKVGYELVLLDGSVENKNYFSELTVMRARILMKL